MRGESDGGGDGGGGGITNRVGEGEAGQRSGRGFEKEGLNKESRVEEGRSAMGQKWRDSSVPVSLDDVTVMQVPGN